MYICYTGWKIGFGLAKCTGHEEQVKGVYGLQEVKWG